MNRTIEIIIGTTGEIQIDAVGFKGPDCEKPTKFLEEALGVVGQKIKKPEYHQRRHQEPAEDWGVKTFSFLWTAKLRAAIGKAAPKAGYHMSLVAEDRQKVIAAVNQGIDAYLEACFVPGRGDSFRFQTPKGIQGKNLRASPGVQGLAKVPARPGSPAHGIRR